MFFVDRIECRMVNRQPSNRLKFNCKRSKKVLFYRQRSKMQININRQKVSRHFKNVTFSADLHGLLASEESGSKREKPVSVLS